MQQDFLTSILPTLRGDTIRVARFIPYANPHIVTLAAWQRQSLRLVLNNQQCGKQYD